MNDLAYNTEINMQITKGSKVWVNGGYREGYN